MIGKSPLTLDCLKCYTDCTVCLLQLGHIYPKPGAPLTEQIIVDLSQNPKELLFAEGDTYPLIFRLETISEKGLTDGHVLEVNQQAILYWQGLLVAVLSSKARTAFHISYEVLSSARSASTSQQSACSALLPCSGRLAEDCMQGARLLSKAGSARTSQQCACT